MTGIEIIDSQHEFIDRTINKLIDVLAKRDKSSYDSYKILEEIIDYYTIHFYTESIFLDKLKISKEKVAEHKKEHADFLKRLHGMQSEKQEITVDLLLSLKDWAKNHISDNDFKDYSTFV